VVFIGATNVCGVRIRACADRIHLRVWVTVNGKTGRLLRFCVHPSRQKGPVRLLQIYRGMPAGPCATHHHPPPYTLGNPACARVHWG